MERIEFSEVQTIIEATYLGILKRYPVDRQVLLQNFRQQFAWACASELGLRLSWKIDAGSVEKWLVVASAGMAEVGRDLLFKNFTVLESSDTDFTDTDFRIGYRARGGSVYSPPEFSLHLAYTPWLLNGWEKIPLGAPNLAMIERYLTVSRLVTPAGKVESLPKKLKPRKQVLEFVCAHLEREKTYAEAELSERLLYHYPDHALLRRELVDFRFLERARDGSWYRVADKSIGESCST